MSLSRPPNTRWPDRGRGHPEGDTGLKCCPGHLPQPLLSALEGLGRSPERDGSRTPQKRCRASQPPPRTDTQGPTSCQPHAVTSSRAVAHHRSGARIPPTPPLLTTTQIPQICHSPHPKKARKGPEAEEGTALPFGLSRGDSQRRGRNTVTAVPPRPPRVPGVQGATLRPPGSAQHQGGKA